MKLLFFESEIKMPVMKLPVRSTVIQSSRGVIVISPIDFSADQLQQIQHLGEVTELVAPSVLHHLHMQKAMQHFPKAKVWGMPGLKEKRSDIKWDYFFTLDSWPYQNEIEAIAIQGVPGMAEVALFCKDIRTLIVTDLVFNLQQAEGLGAAVLLRILGTHKRFAVSRLLGRFMKDRSAFKASLDQILQKSFDQIVMGHGQIVTGNGRQLFEQALRERDYLD